MFSLGRGGAAAQFHTTSWSLVIAAAGQPTESADAALATLCQLYWYPVYAFVRRQGHSQDDARDLTQEYFARLLEKHYLKDADPERGRFRSFLLATVRHFLANEWHRGQAQKRGGGVPTITLDPDAAEHRYSLQPADQETPENLYERQWALALLDQVMLDLRNAYGKDGRLDHFEKLAPYLAGITDIPYAEIAVQWNSTEGAVKVAIHRIRKRYREMLRRTIAQTVVDPAEVDDEIRFLLSALGTSP